MSDINVSISDSDSSVTVVVSDVSDPIIVTVSEQLNAVANWQDVLGKPDFGDGAGEFAEGNDERFVTNGDLHDHSGGDGGAITESALSFSDVLTGNVNSNKHGLMPKSYPKCVVVTGADGNVTYVAGFTTPGKPLISTASGYPVFGVIALSGITSGVSGILAVSNGGTGSETQNFVDLTTSQSIAGDKNFTGSVTVNTLKVNSSTLQPACSANFGVGLGVTDATLPLVQIKNTSAPADKKYVRLGVNTSGAFGLGRVNDAYSTETLFLRYDAGDNLYLSPAGLTALVVPYIASATNYHQFNSSAGGTPIYYTQGSASDVSLGLSSKGTGNIFFFTNNSTTAQFQVASAASAVNRLVALGAATAGLPQLYAAGTDTNIGFGLSSKGTYGFGFWTGGGQQFGIGNTASAVNYLSTYGGVAGAGISLTAIGTDTNIQNYINAKGSYPTSFTGAGGAEQFRVATIASAVNFMQVQGAVASGYTAQSNAGTSTDIGHSYITKGAGPHAFFTGGGQQQFAIGHVASAVNYMAVWGSATGSAPAVIANGSDANIDIALTPKGIGRVKGTMLSFACERSTLPTVGLTFAFGNGNSAGLGAVMPFAGKLVAVGISGMGVNGTLTADAYIDGVANTSYQISLTGSATNVKNYVTYSTPLSFVAGTSINWQVSAVPTAGTGFIITFFVVFN